MIDCLFIGHNDGSFPEYVDQVRAMGPDAGPWRRVNLSFVELDGVPRRAMDVLNRVNGRDGRRRPTLNNMEGLSPTIAYLASHVRRHGFSFDFVTLFQDERRRLARLLRGGDVMAVAITTTFYVGTWWIEEIVHFVRRLSPSTRIIVGGPYLYNQSVLAPERMDELFAELDADVYVISREGELALTRVLDALKGRRSLGAIDNIAYRRRGRFVRTTASPEVNPLAANPVDYDLFPSRIGEFVAIRTSKSCPFACAFCSYPQQAGAYVYEGIDAVEQELDRIRRVGTVTTLAFIDDTVNVPRGRFKDLLRMMIGKGYRFRWNANLRADHADAECIDLMRRSGCEGVFLGVESGSDAMLKRMNKTSRSADYRRVIPQLRDAGILTHCSLIIGFPGETRDTVRETIDLIEEARPDTYRAHLWYCDPTTPVWRKRHELGLEGAQFDWRHSTMDSAMAADLVDELFLTVQNSTWLPQHGFDSRCLFYLQRKGMPLPQILRFLRAFNDAVRFRLRHPDAPGIEPSLLAQLEECGRFEPVRAGARPSRTDAAPPALSAARA